MNYPQVLESLGFSKKEIAVYISLLELDAATPVELAKRTDLHRVTCYDVLAELLRRGIISKFKKSKRIYFRAGDPRQLLKYLDNEKNQYVKKIDNQKKEVLEIMPELMSRLNPNSSKPKVEFFEGEKGVREAYEDSLVSEDVYYSYANVEEVHKGIPNFFPDYYQRRAKLGIRAKAIFTNNKASLDLAKSNKEEKRETMFFTDSAKTFTPEVVIYNNKILVASWKEKMAVIIESKELAELQKIIFEELWRYMKNDPEVTKVV